MGDVIAEAIWYFVIFIFASTIIVVIISFLTAIFWHLTLSSLADLYPEEKANLMRPKLFQSKIFQYDSTTWVKYITKEAPEDSEKIKNIKKKLKKIGKFYDLILIVIIVLVVLILLLFLIIALL